ncbi:hypothetical protein EJP82_25095 [Paenibacillus anaericanus]|uniref:Uncharacterized protein n=1 Tax=Paenibacillus anaericanus TaxID=170367 RepID=A0A433XZ53_9BACL|nr:hypothetical protein EJP82_25095 [Paenibacillus anaericanus]
MVCPDHALERYLQHHPLDELVNDAHDSYSNGSPAPNWGQVAALKYAKKYAQLEYTVTIEIPKFKDTNEDLLAFRSNGVACSYEIRSCTGKLTGVA